MNKFLEKYKLSKPSLKWNRKLILSKFKKHYLTKTHSENRKRKKYFPNHFMRPTSTWYQNLKDITKTKNKKTNKNNYGSITIFHKCGCPNPPSQIWIQQHINKLFIMTTKGLSQKCKTGFYWLTLYLKSQI